MRISHLSSGNLGMDSQEKHRLAQVMRGRQQQMRRSHWWIHLRKQKRCRQPASLWMLQAVDTLNQVILKTIAHGHYSYF